MLYRGSSQSRFSGNTDCQHSQIARSTGERNACHHSGGVGFSAGPSRLIGASNAIVGVAAGGVALASAARGVALASAAGGVALASAAGGVALASAAGGGASAVSGLAGHCTRSTRVRSVHVILAA